MSIELRDSAGSSLSSFSGCETEFDLGFAEKKPIVVQESKPIEKTKKNQIKKKEKPKKRYFYELLAESYKKGIFNRCHSTGEKNRRDRTTKELQNSYSCPILCVAELLGWIPSDDTLEHSHYDLARKMIRDKSIITYDGDITCSLCGYTETGEPLFAQHLACDDGKIRHNNMRVVEQLIKQLYSPKKQMTKSETEKMLIESEFESRFLDASTLPHTNFLMDATNDAMMQYVEDLKKRMRKI